LKAEENTIMKLRAAGHIKVEDVRPCQDLLIIETLQEDEVSKGGIIIPEISREKPLIGVVLAAGPGRPRKDGSLIPMDCQVGDWVAFSQYANMEMIFDPIQGKQYKIIHDDHIVCKFIRKENEHAERSGQ
jgi:chaperonin GroES